MNLNAIQTKFLTVIVVIGLSPAFMVFASERFPQETTFVIEQFGKVVRLDGNDVNKLNESADTMKNCRQLRLSNNKLTGIKELEASESLQCLWLDGNQIADDNLHDVIKDIVAKFPNLSFLDLSGNCFSKIDGVDIKKLSKLHINFLVLRSPKLERETRSLLQNELQGRVDLGAQPMLPPLRRKLSLRQCFGLPV